MKRRDFIRKSATAGITGSAIINNLYMNKLFAGPEGFSLSLKDIPSPYLNRLTVKPIMAGMYHTDIWEGPCRFRVASMEQEKNSALRSFENFSTALKNNKFDQSGVEVLEPTQILFVEDFIIKEEEWIKIDADARNADVVIQQVPSSWQHVL